jgi:predicted RNase H-like nuclease (RuvC/YqgF family)
MPPQQTDPDLRELALQIATMLPQDPAEARQVLRVLRGDAEPAASRPQPENEDTTALRHELANAKTREIALRQQLAEADRRIALLEKNLKTGPTVQNMPPLDEAIAALEKKLEQAKKRNAELQADIRRIRKSPNNVAFIDGNLRRKALKEFHSDRVQADAELKQQYEEFFKVLNNVLKSLPVREV